MFLFDALFDQGLPLWMFVLARVIHYLWYAEFINISCCTVFFNHQQHVLQGTNLHLLCLSFWSGLETKTLSKWVKATPLHKWGNQTYLTMLHTHRHIPLAAWLDSLGDLYWPFQSVSYLTNTHIRVLVGNVSGLKVERNRSRSLASFDHLHLRILLKPLLFFKLRRIMYFCEQNSFAKIKKKKKWLFFFFCDHL